MRALIIVCVLLFSSTLRADINTMGETKVQESDGIRITTLISAGWVRYFIHLDDLSKAERVIICETPFREIEALGLDAWSALKQANVTYEKGAKRFYLSEHLEYLACVGIGSDDEN